MLLRSIWEPKRKLMSTLVKISISVFLLTKIGKQIDLQSS